MVSTQDNKITLPQYADVLKANPYRTTNIYYHDSTKNILFKASMQPPDIVYAKTKTQIPKKSIWIFCFPQSQYWLWNISWSVPQMDHWQSNDVKANNWKSWQNRKTAENINTDTTSSPTRSLKYRLKIARVLRTDFSKTPTAMSNLAKVFFIYLTARELVFSRRYYDPQQKTPK